MPLPSKFSVSMPIEVVASGGALVRQVDTNGVALDDSSYVYSVAIPVMPVDVNGQNEDATRIFSTHTKVTIHPNGLPVVRVDASGVAVSTSLLGGTPTLNVLTLSNYAYAENSAPAFVIANIVGTTGGSTLSLVDSASNKVALSGTNLVVGATNSDFESTPTYNITIRETLAGAIGTPKDTVLTLTVTNVYEQPSLSVLSFSSTSWTNGTSASGAIIGATSGSTISISGAPTGLTINSGARTWAFDGTGAAGSGSFTLTQTLADSANSPHSDTLSYTIAASGGGGGTNGQLDFSSPSQSGLIFLLEDI